MDWRHVSTHFPCFTFTHTFLYIQSHIILLRVPWIVSQWSKKSLSKDCDIETMTTGTLLAQHHQAKHLVGESVFRKPDVLKKKMSCFRNHRLNLLTALDFVSPSLPVRFIEVLRCLPRGFFSRPRCLPTPCGQARSGLPHSRSEHCQGSHGWKIGRWRVFLGEKKLIYIYHHNHHIYASSSIFVGFCGYTISH